MSVNMESVNQNAREHRVKDPVCGMTVDPQSAAGFYEYKGQTYFFCSVGCRERFKADPERFLNHEPASPIGIQRGPKPQPVATTRGSDTVTYTCPMHPEIVRDKPGSCPICGMALEPRTIALDEGPNPELLDMTRRFGIASLLAAPVVLMAMGDMVMGPGLGGHLGLRSVNW